MQSMAACASKLVKFSQLDTFSPFSALNPLFRMPVMRSLASEDLNDSDDGNLYLSAIARACSLRAVMLRIVTVRKRTSNTSLMEITSASAMIGAIPATTAQKVLLKNTILLYQGVRPYRSRTLNQAHLRLPPDITEH
jgi:hypothetical protein